LENLIISLFQARKRERGGKGRGEGFFSSSLISWRVAGRGKREEFGKLLFLLFYFYFYEKGNHFEKKGGEVIFRVGRKERGPGGGEAKGMSSNWCCGKGKGKRGTWLSRGQIGNGAG